MSYLQSLVLIFLVPILYLSCRSFSKIRKVAIFSLAVSIPVAITFELIAFGDNAWYVPQSTFAFRLFGVIPIEDLLWQFMTVYLIIIFYEHFCNKEFLPSISPKIHIMNYVLYSIALVVVAIFTICASIIKIPYAFLWLGILFFPIQIVLFLWKYPQFSRSFLRVQLYFLYTHMIFELIGVKFSHWVFGGSHYIGWVSVLGQRFPLEELIFVMLLGALAACTYYEFFTNKKLA